MLEELGRGAAQAGAQLPPPRTPAVSLIGVSSLWAPGILVEIEAVAVID